MMLAVSAASVAFVLLVATGAGVFAARAVVPPGRPAERSGWGVVLGIAALAGTGALSLLWPGVSVRVLLGCVLLLLMAAAVGLRPSSREEPAAPASRWKPVDAALAAAVLAGVLLYALRALTEPMWSNDFLAIWGLKGRTLFATRVLSSWPFRDPAAAFSHREYPIGLPLLFAGLAGAIGRWDDHGAALLFPAMQAATLAVLYGWLRRRGASRSIALSAAALLSWCEPLYSAFLTGMAEVPLAGILLLLAVSWSDARDGTDTGAIRRVAAACVFAAATKNEGLFAAGAAGALTLLARRSPTGFPRRKVAAACLVPAAAVWLAHRAALGFTPLEDFDAGLLAPGRLAELPARAAQAAAAILDVGWRPAWPALLALAVIAIAGRRSPAADRILGIAAVLLGAYLLLPLFAVRGPDWLIRTTLLRITAALAPMLAAGLALRVARLSPGPPAPRGDGAIAAAAGPIASEERGARRTPSIPAS